MSQQKATHLNFPQVDERIVEAARVVAMKEPSGLGGQGDEIIAVARMTLALNERCDVIVESLKTYFSRTSVPARTQSKMDE
jgi:hypothetical protein